MPRPEVTMVTFTIDGREVTAPQNAMLVDAALIQAADARRRRAS